jgi:hypothetical protein
LEEDEALVGIRKLALAFTQLALEGLDAGMLHHELLGVVFCEAPTNVGAALALVLGRAVHLRQPLEGDALALVPLEKLDPRVACHYSCGW